MFVSKTIEEAEVVVEALRGFGMCLKEARSIKGETSDCDQPIVAFAEPG